MNAKSAKFLRRVVRARYTNPRDRLSVRYYHHIERRVVQYPQIVGAPLEFMHVTRINVPGSIRHTYQALKRHFNAAARV